MFKLNKTLFYIGLIFITALLLTNCNQGSEQDSQQSEQAIDEHAFKKEGTLTLIQKSAADSSASKTIEIEIADTEPQRQKGLMYRTSMKMDRGMLFVFEEEKPQSFWMKNTAIALDMAFINSALEIVALQKYVPVFTEEGRNSKGLPAKYVLEVNAGFMDKFGFKKGDSINFSRVE